MFCCRRSALTKVRIGLLFLSPAFFLSGCIPERRKDFMYVLGAKKIYSVDFSGQKSLKVSMSLLSSLQPQSRRKRRRTMKGPDAEIEMFSDAGVKRMMLLAVFPEVDETFESIENLVSSLKLRVGSKRMLCADLKVVNMSLGLQSYQCRHPCPFCEWRKGEDKHDHPERTFENIRHNFERFQEQASGKKEKVKNFFNCIRPASALFPENGRVIDVVALPELHLLLGVVNKLFVELKGIDARVAKEWSRNELHLRPAPWSGQFVGNDCHTLLKKTDRLRDIANRLPARQRTKRAKINRLADAFQSFQKLVHSCFGNTLHDTWEKDLINFRESYRATGASISPKVHIIIAHLNYFVGKFGALGIFSEQAGEAIHHDFKREFQKYNIKDRDNPKYAENLLRAVSSYNGNNMN